MKFGHNREGCLSIAGRRNSSATSSMYLKSFVSFWIKGVWLIVNFYFRISYTTKNLELIISILTNLNNDYPLNSIYEMELRIVITASW